MEEAKSRIDDPIPLEQDEEYLTGFKLWSVHAAITLIVFLIMLDTTIIVTAIPQITSDFHSLSDIGWYGSAYLLASCALQPLTGKLYTYFSLKYTLLGFLAIFEVGSVLCGAAHSSTMMIVGRAVAGMGSAGLSNGGLTILNASAPMHKQPFMLGLMLSISQIGMVAGPVIGGALTEYSSWRWCFYINLPIGAASSILLLLIKIPNRRGAEETQSRRTIRGILSQLDLAGFVLFASFAVMFLLALQWGGTRYPWNNATIVGLFCGSGGALVLFAAWDYRAGDEALIPISMIKKRIVWCSCFSAAFFFGAMLIFSYYLPIYFQAVKGVSSALSGVYMLPSIGSQIVMAGISGALLGKLGYYLPWSVASAVLVAVAAGLMSTLTPHTSTAKWVMYQIIAGIGRGCGMQIPIIAIQNTLAPPQIALGMALIMLVQLFGGSLCLTLAQSIFTHSLGSALKEYAPTVDAQAVIGAGATSFRKVVESEDLRGVLRAYNEAIDRDFYLSAGAAVGMFVFCWGMGWCRIIRENDAVAGKQGGEKV